MLPPLTFAHLSKISDFQQGATKRKIPTCSLHQMQRPNWPIHYSWQTAVFKARWVTAWLIVGLIDRYTDQSVTSWNFGCIGLQQPHGNSGQTDMLPARCIASVFRPATTGTGTVPNQDILVFLEGHIKTGHVGTIWQSDTIVGKQLRERSPQRSRVTF